MSGTAEYEDGTTEPADGFAWTPAWLATVRRRSTHRRTALVAAALVGIGLAWIHWVGLFVAGALVGLPSRTVPRAVATALLFGALVLVVQVLASPVVDPGSLLGFAPLSFVTVGAALLAPVWGSLVRGVV